MVAQLVTGIIAGTVREFGIALATTNVPIRTEFTAIDTVEPTYLEFVLPGLVGVMIMNASLAAVGMGVRALAQRRRYAACLVQQRRRSEANFN